MSDREPVFDECSVDDSQPRTFLGKYYGNRDWLVFLDIKTDDQPSKAMTWNKKRMYGQMIMINVIP
jgi:hypothetical protein